MTRFISALVILGLATPAFADLQAVNQKTDELELEQEVESVEAFGSDAAAEETRRETERLSKETHGLERDISNMKAANVRAEEKTKRLAALYQKKAALATEVQKQAATSESRKNKSERDVARLQAKVKAKEQKVISSVDKRKKADTKVAELKKSEKQLQRRLRVAENTIKRNETRRKVLRAQALRLAQRQSKLNREVVRAESKAKSKRM